MRRSARAGTAFPFVNDRALGRDALHSYSVRRNVIRSSVARKRLSLMSGASSRPSAFSFISRLASTWRCVVFVLSWPTHRAMTLNG